MEYFNNALYRLNQNKQIININKKNIENNSIFRRNFTNLIPIFAFIPQYIYKFNIKYCMNKPFTTYYQNIPMDDIKSRNLNILKYCVILLPLCIYNDYIMSKKLKNTCNIAKLKTESLAHFSLFHLASSFIIPVLYINSFGLLINKKILFKKSSYLYNKYFNIALLILSYTIFSGFIDNIILDLYTKTTKFYKNNNNLASL